MSPQTDRVFEARVPDQVRGPVQEAVDACCQAHEEHRTDDVEEWLRVALARRGVRLDDEIWFNEVGDKIRTGHLVVVRAA